MVGGEEADRLVVMAALGVDVAQALRDVVVEDLGVVLLDDALEGGDRIIIDAVCRGITLDTMKVRDLSNDVLKNDTEIANWNVFREETLKTTLSRWCKRTFGLNFQEYYKKNGGMAMKISLRKNQLKLSEKSAAMAIFLGKNYLGQTDKYEQGVELIEDLTPLAELLNEPDEND